MPITAYLRQVIERRAALTRSEAGGLMHAILNGQASDIEIAALLGALAGRGEAAEELAGFVDAMRAAATPLPLDQAERSQLTDTCGTGGDGSGTFNISTAAALVAAAAGARVAKHGNRAVTSKSGSADVLGALGIPVDLTPAQAADAIRAHGFAYLHAPLLHPAMKAVMPVRRALGVRTVFNLIGPLTNPAGAQAQVVGVYAADRVDGIAETLALLRTRHAIVVHGFTDDTCTTGMDELSICGPSHIAEILEGRIVRSVITPEELGFDRAPLSSLQGGDAFTNAAILRAVFRGEAGPPRDVVVLNAAAVLVTAGLAPVLQAGVLLAQQAIDSGKVVTLLEALAVVGGELSA